MADFPSSVKTFPTLVDLIDSVLASHQNERGAEITALETFLTAAAFRRGYARSSTLSGDLALADSDTAIQPIDCNGANRIVSLPASSADNHPFLLINKTAATYLLQVKTAGGTLLAVLQPAGESILIVPDGSTGWKPLTPSGVGVPASLSTRIEGMKLIRASATTVTVGMGSCFAPNGDLINITSAITTAALTLAAATWYHVYVYLNAGVPAVEVVTTAPTTWKGTASGKTGDTSRRYVGSVRTYAASGNIFAFEHHVQSNYIAYTNNQGDVPFGVLGGGAAVVETTVSAAAVVPVTSKLMYAKFFGISQNICLGNSEDNVSVPTTSIVVVAAGKDAYVNFPLDANQAFTYAMAAAGGAGYAQVVGYYFDR